jgi:RNA polymerase sigma-70 factor (ECF subfamily)
MLVLLESLSPEQRAVLLLHDVFDYGYPWIAAIVGKSEDNVRQLASRARRHVEQRRPRFQTTREQRDELARRFFAAAEHRVQSVRGSDRGGVAVGEIGNS